MSALFPELKESRLHGAHGAPNEHSHTSPFGPFPFSHVPMHLPCTNFRMHARLFITRSSLVCLPQRTLAAMVIGRARSTLLAAHVRRSSELRAPTWPNAPDLSHAGTCKTGGCNKKSTPVYMFRNAEICHFAVQLWSGSL